MNDSALEAEDVFRHSGRQIITDQAFARSLENSSLKNKQFERLVAKNKHFNSCDFSYSHFESAYLRSCTFDSCNFTGCRFSNSNLRGSKFIGCKFDYVEFSNTLVEPEVLNESAPSVENLQQKFARTLRLNFQQIGDNIAANKAIRFELGANRTHLKKAWNSRESYYRKKYKRLKRASAFFEWVGFVSLDFFWGNGESPIKLLRSLAFVVFSIAFGDTFLFIDSSMDNKFLLAVIDAPQVFLGLLQPERFPGLVLAAIATIRYLMLACLVSIFVKRFSRR